MEIHNTMHMLDTTLAEWLKLEKNEIQNSE